jgi:arylsulfatase A-like enzyme
MSTIVNRCSHLDEHNISQELSKDIRYMEHMSVSAAVGPTGWDFINPAEVTIASVMAAAGYRTAHMGKWHNAQVRQHSISTAQNTFWNI